MIFCNPLSFSLFHFHFSELVTQVMSVATLIANIGGMLGLCLGFSFVSLVEIVFFFFSALMNMMQR